MLLEAYFDTFLNFEHLPDTKMLKLDTMRHMVELLGHPELAYQTIHITGSKGKGSTAAMLANIIAAHTGEPVGIFFSPHFTDFRERVTSTNGFFPDKLYKVSLAELQSAVANLKDDNIKRRLTWFEMVTLFAFLVFKNAGLRYAVFEVGMGGRLDATNVIQPCLSLITNIELEHTQFLGDTLAQIAREKAGIIKPHTPVIIGAKHPETAPVFEEVAAAQHAPLHFVKSTTSIPQLQLLGAHQVANAALATAAARLLFPAIGTETINTALAATTLPGRFDIRTCNSRPVVLDSAHTVNSIKSTLGTFAELYKDQPADLLFALADGKDAATIIPLLKTHPFAHVYLTKPGDFKKSTLWKMERLMHSAGINPVLADADFVKVISAALSGTNPLLVTGSFYLSAEVAKLML